MSILSFRAMVGSASVLISAITELLATYVGQVINQKISRIAADLRNSIKSEITLGLRYEDTLSSMVVPLLPKSSDCFSGKKNRLPSGNGEYLVETKGVSRDQSSR